MAKDHRTAPGNAKPQLGEHQEARAELGARRSRKSITAKETHCSSGDFGFKLRAMSGKPSNPGNAKPQLGEHQEARTEPVPSAPRGWYSRGYLPHYDNKKTIQSVTFRLADSLPQSKLREIENEIAASPRENVDAARRKKIEAWLDAGLGCCALKHPALATVLQDTLLKWDGDRYRMIAYCIMPNHVHVLMETNAGLPKIVQSWKSYTGRWALRKNAELGLGIPGKALWMREYWDRYIRDADHLDNVRVYIERNPVTAGLCKQPSDWPWSSASPGNASPGNAKPQLGENTPSRGSALPGAMG